LRSACRTFAPPTFNIIGLCGFRLAFQQVQPDTASPELVLLGGEEISHLVGQPWVEPGVEAHDIWDGNLSGRVSVSGLVDVNRTGLYVLTYTVFDSAGNLATGYRKVKVLAATHTADLNSSVQLEMLWVKPGTFTMGSPVGETGRGTNEIEHNVTLTQGFYLGKYEVTQAQYEAVMTGNSDGLSATPSFRSNNPNRPVESVSWDDVQIFLTRLNASEQAAGHLPTGWSYVLPTESQWEYACRAGTTTAYSWGATIATSNANYLSSGISQTTDVGQYGANPWGFFDMHGNVYEWCADWYDATYSTGSLVIDPTGPTSGSSRVIRSGSYHHEGRILRSSSRSYFSTNNRYLTIGFRLSFQKQS
jgi:formylglycine-generating enzyme required for sulfatase activity